MFAVEIYAAVRKFVFIEGNSRREAARVFGLSPTQNVKSQINLGASPASRVLSRDRFNVAVAVDLSDARIKSVELTIAIVPAGTSLPAVSREPVISLCALCGSLLRRPVELGLIDPHAVQDKRASEMR
jgi:hypothetical protein